MGLVIVRKLMDYIFTQNELFYLDQVYPKHEKSNKSDKIEKVIAKHKKSFFKVKINYFFQFRNLALI